MKKQLKNEVVLRYPSIVRPKNPKNANDFLLSSFLICLECEGSIGLQEVERDNWHERQEADGLLGLRGHNYWPLDLKNHGMLDWVTLTQPLCNRQQLCPLNPSYACQKAVRPLPFMSIITLNLLEPNASFTRQANQRGRQKNHLHFWFFLGLRILFGFFPLYVRSRESQITIEIIGIYFLGYASPGGAPSYCFFRLKEKFICQLKVIIFQTKML